MAEYENPWGECAAVAYRDLTFKVKQAFSANMDIIAYAEIFKAIFEVNETHLINSDIITNLRTK